MLIAVKQLKLMCFCPTAEDAQAIAKDRMTSGTIPPVARMYNDKSMATNPNRTTTLMQVTLTMSLTDSCQCPRDIDGNSAQHSSGKELQVA